MHPSESDKRLFWFTSSTKGFWHTLELISIVAILSLSKVGGRLTALPMESTEMIPIESLSVKIKNNKNYVLSLEV